MSEHLTQVQARDYWRRQLSSTELLSVSDHLAECEKCRRRIEVAGGSETAFLALRSAVFGDDQDPLSPQLMREHLTADQTAGYVDGSLAGGELQMDADHISSCDQCVLAVDDLRAFKAQVAASLDREYRPALAESLARARRHRAVFYLPTLLGRSPALALGVALSVILVAVTGWLVWRSQRPTQPTPRIAVLPGVSPESQPAAELQPAPGPQATPDSQLSPGPQPTPYTQPSLEPRRAPVSRPAPVPAAAHLVALNDGRGKLTLDQEGRLSGADELPPAYQSRLKDALANRRIGTSPQLKGLARPPSSLMSTDKERTEFSVIEPVGRVLMTDRPAFRWSRMEGAASYVVEVYDENFNLVASSPGLEANSWSMPQSLPRGRVYGWQVKVMKDGQEIKSPRPPAPQARFRVLDSVKAIELERARRAYPSSHLVLGLLYAEAGLLSDAEHELRLLQQANPDSEIARSLLNQVQALRR